VLDHPSLEGVRNCGDRVPDTFSSGSSPNSTTTLTNRTDNGNSAVDGGVEFHSDSKSRTTLTHTIVAGEKAGGGISGAGSVSG
jgi:hypothetical protein